MNSREFLAKLHDALGSELLARIQSGKASSGDLAVALNMLKHNNYILEITKDDPLAKLMDQLPQFDQNLPHYQ